jgi:hypothetical protein
MLPIAVQWVLAVMMLLLVGGVVWIAVMQIRVATAKHNLDLYDKRFKIFEAAGRYLQHLLVEGRVSETALNEFNIGVAGAVFLFDNDLNIYLDALRRRGLSLNALTEQLSSIELDAEGRDELIDKIDAWVTDFKLEYSRLVNAFTPYLKRRGI